jgi:murein DD-endopeptidase MepM/ murein hydrolase activator NlpD
MAPRTATPPIESRAQGEPRSTSGTAPAAGRAAFPAPPVRTAAAYAPTNAAAAPASSGRSIDVAPGDTLYGLARKHGVSVAALMSVNGLTSPMIKPGQRLVLPDASAMAAPPPKADQPTARQDIRQEARSRRTTDSAPPIAVGGEYTIKPGDSIYAIAKRANVSSEEIAQLNGIADVKRIRPGQVIKIPAASSAAVKSEKPTRVASAAPMASSAANPAADAQPAPAVEDKAEPARPAAEVASAKPNEPTAPAAAAGKDTMFRWPAKGRVIAKFGPRPNGGAPNDGINIAVPAGTDVQAAEEGTVVYSGSELKGYGNLVLIRHDEIWVSAYAHNEKLLVKRGDKIKRGQVIAKAGKSGEVDSPQIHFELRRESKPVDPLKHLTQN